MGRTQFLLCLFVITVGFFFIDAEAGSAIPLPAEGIIGGDIADEGQFPYQVSLEAYGISFCGGSILTERLILTAAHCVVENNGSFAENSIKVIAGTSNLNSTSSRIAIDVVRIFVPKIYDPTVLEAINKIPIGDIAILKLNESLPMEGNPKLRKVKLSRLRKTYEGMTAIVSGFGYNKIDVVTDPETGEYTEANGKSFGKLRFAKANVVSYEACQNIFSPKTIEKSHICAGIVQRDKKHPEGLCSGDSGGPLVYNGIQIGVLSISPFGCRENIKPAIYTRVTYYTADFIRKVVKNEIDENIRTKLLKISPRWIDLF